MPLNTFLSSFKMLVMSKVLCGFVPSSQVDKVKNPRGGCGFLSRGGGCKFFESEGGYPPLTPKKFSPVAVTIFYSTFFIKFHALNGIVSPPQAKIFINDVIKVQNQAIGMILHITI